MREVDCSTIRVCCEMEDIKNGKLFAKKLGKRAYTGGFLRLPSKDIYIHGNQAKVDNIICVISHESLHKIICETIGIDECYGLDTYLKFTGSYQKGDVDWSGVKLK